MANLYTNGKNPSITYKKGEEPEKLQLLWKKRRGVYEAAKAEYTVIDAEISRVAAQLAGLPEGMVYRVSVTEWGAMRLTAVPAPKPGTAKTVTTATLADLAASLTGSKLIPAAK